MMAELAVESTVTTELKFEKYRMLIIKQNGKLTYDIDLDNQKAPVRIHFDSYQDLYKFTQFLLRGQG